jgi:anthranilate/para-aminobenzoate synthase component I
VFAWPELGVVAASPELCLSLDAGGTARTRPIKGTRPRHADRERDRELARELDLDPKERAELAMVIDVERSDLGRVARPGSVRLVEEPRVESHPGVHHRVATVEAALRAGVSRTELLSAMLPSGSVTGAPKIRAMEVIAELEPVRRGLYTGAFGVLGQDGGLELAMAIRVLTLQGSRGRYFSGGGIVADSNPAREVEETLWKASALVRTTGGGVENWA